MAAPDLASPATILEVMAEQRARDAALAAHESDELKAKATRQKALLEIDRRQMRARVDSQRLMRDLWAVPVTKWTESQSELYALIVEWLDAEELKNG
jgi:hypothetical protein